MTEAEADIDLLARRGFTPERLAAARARHDSLDQLCGTPARKGEDGWTWRFSDDDPKDWRLCYNYTRLKKDVPTRGSAANAVVC